MRGHLLRRGGVIRASGFLFGVALVSSLFCGNAFAASATDPAAVVNDLVSNALGMLADKNLAAKDREIKFQALFDQDFDVPRIARFVVGPYWNNASEEDRQSFGQLFEQWVVHIYAGGLGNYNGEKVEVTGSRPMGETTMVVSSRVVHPDSATSEKVDWVLRRGNEGYKVIDVNVEGMSLVMTAREEITSAIDHNGGTVAGANNALRLKLAKAD